MKLEFLNVNQGDSILITWPEHPNKCGIIDCSLENGNPILNSVKTLGISEIEFIILSHPHVDHFSGINELLKYCKLSGIKINNLGLTFDTLVSISYLKFYSYPNQLLLKEFFEEVLDQSRKPKTSYLKNIFSISKDTAPIQVNNLTLTFRSPLLAETIKISRSLSKLVNGDIVSPPNLNVYSTVIELKYNEKFILLTSDAILSYFKKLNNFYNLNPSIKFELVQIPHHGSNKNYLPKFWQELNVISDCPAVFSIGDEPKDELPDYDVVSNVDSLNFKIHSTNYVYGLKDYFAGKPVKKSPTPVILSSVSKLVKTTYHGLSPNLSGTQAFLF